MAKAVQKITLSASRDIPFNKLVLSQSNVRRIKAGVSIEELAEDIARRTLLQSLTVRPVLDADGNETGMFEIPAGGRRYRALELLVKQKRLAKTAPIPCIVARPTRHRRGGHARRERPARAAASARPVPRLPGPAREGPVARRRSPPPSSSSVNVVRQRLRLAAVSPKLLDVYAEDGMTLEQLMALHGQPRSCAPGAGLGGAAALLHQGALPDPPPADRGRRARLRQARAVRRRRGL